MQIESAGLKRQAVPWLYIWDSHGLVLPTGCMAESERRVAMM